MYVGDWSLCFHQMVGAGDSDPNPAPNSLLQPSTQGKQREREGTNCKCRPEIGAPLGDNPKFPEALGIVFTLGNASLLTICIPAVRDLQGEGTTQRWLAFQGIR